MTRDDAPRTEVRRAGDRFVTAEPGRTTRHSFSFGRHYDPDNVGLADLVAHNDDRVEPRGGYPEHPHRDLEIVTWVLSGTLRHEDSTGHSGELRAGTVQRLSAGSGIRHSETNPDPDEPVHFVQMWVLPDEPGLEPGYEQRDVDADLGRGGWVSLASGNQAYADDPAVRLCNSRSVLHAARLQRGGSVRLPEPHGARPGQSSVFHLFVARGGVEMESLGELDTGDAARLVGAGGQLVTAPNEAEVLLWEMHPGPR